ncbi:MAG: hypothetical protein AAGD06_01690 [Acidobacteriota bacterium]
MLRPPSPRLLLAAFVLAVLWLGPHSVAQDPPPADPPPVAAGQSGAVDDDLETFVPSEELSADDAISFPVDI